MDTRAHGCVFLLGSAAVLGLYCFLRVLPHEVRNERPHGRFTHTQIVERAVQLAYLFSGDGRDLFVAPDPGIGLRDPRPAVPLWFVDYSDQSGKHLGRLEWDGQTGTLLGLDRSALVPIGRPSATGGLNQAQAVGRAIFWARKLFDIAGLTSSHVRGKMERAGDVWVVTLTDGNRKFWVRIHGPTGELVGLHLKHPAAHAGGN